jgi:hypothetical protein
VCSPQIGLLLTKKNTKKLHTQKSLVFSIGKPSTVHQHMKGGKVCIGVGVVSLILGLLFIFVGTFGVDYELPKQKTDYLVIDSEVCILFSVVEIVHLIWN